ncbi:hypothetical protein [Rhodococcus sp. ARC_M6]|nr:hypothetical protein [Rhodococcus sp. ARC_M6]
MTVGTLCGVHWDESEGHSDDARTQGSDETLDSMLPRWPKWRHQA